MPNGLTLVIVNRFSNSGLDTFWTRNNLKDIGGLPDAERSAV
jgi:hypothetical protein